MTSYGKAQLTDRLLQDRGYITLVFPEKGKGKVTKSITSNKKIKIPFFENPIIQESKQSRLATYKLIGRNSDLFSYLGADARAIQLRITLTLPHLFHFMKSSPWMDKDTAFNKVPKFNIVRKNITNILLNDRTESLGSKSYKDDEYERGTRLARKFVNGEIDSAVDSYYSQDGVRLKQGMEAFDAQYSELLGEDSYQLDPDTRGVRAAFVYYINLLRSTTLGSEQLGLGAPIIRLNFGPLYQDVPCIAMKYNLEMDDQAGYDIATMLPRRVTFNLDLQEVRVGDFSTHSPEPFGPSDDNVPTWDSVLQTGAFDPRLEPRLSNPSTIDTFRNSDSLDRRDLRRRR